MAAEAQAACVQLSVNNGVAEVSACALSYRPTMACGGPWFVTPCPPNQYLFVHDPMVCDALPA
eukprot:1192713-Prorocentrum_minimum.AAC.1